MIELLELVALESSVWEALRSGDAAADLRVLSEDFLGVYPTGFASRADHAAQVALGPTIGAFEIVDVHTLVLSDEDVVLAYRANFTRPGQANRTESMYVSSVWSHRGGRWLNVFSQDTPTTYLDSASSEATTPVLPLV